MANRSKTNRDGYELLIEAVLLGYANCIKDKGYFNICYKGKNHFIWLEKQKEWVKADKKFISAYADCFDYDVEKIKKGFLILIDKQIRKEAKLASDSAKK